MPSRMELPSKLGFPEAARRSGGVLPVSAEKAI